MGIQDSSQGTSGLERNLSPRESPDAAAGHATVSVCETPDIRDIDSVLRAARALSEEIQVDRLVQTLMRIALKTASAERGLLLRVHGDSAMIEAGAVMTADGIDVELTESKPGVFDLSNTMLYTVIRTRQPVSISASHRPSPFAADPYLRQHLRCAAICIPMLKQAKLVGVLYLENRLSLQPFGTEQTKVLSLLAAQAAISLETARLFADLLEENQHRRCIEKALRESKATLLLGEQINQSGSWTWELGRGVFNCSAEFCRIFGFDPSSPDIPFARFLERIHADDRERVMRQTNESVASGRSIVVEYRIVLESGSVRYISGVGQPMQEAEVAMYVGTAVDITARRSAEDSLHQAQAELARVSRVTTVGQLTASIAHEINQPLMSISSNAGASLRWLDRDPPQLDHVRRGLLDIAAQSQRAGETIRGLQALTRKSPPVLQPVDLHNAIQHILSISHSELERKNVVLELSLRAGSGWVIGDAVQLQQVLLNIVMNAIEAMSDVQGRERRLAISSRSVSGDRITVQVDDSGIGLGTTSARQVFEPFYSTKRNGMGMGLAICQSIIEAHHGCVTAEVREPQGFSVLFTLPEHWR